MSVDKNSMLVKTKPGTDLRALTSRIQKADLSFSVNKTVKGEIIIKSKTNPLDIDSIKVEIPEIESAAYGLNFEGEETPIFINGEILLQPKPGVTIDRILHLIEGEYNSFVKRRYNTFKVLIRDWNKVISLANLIYESDLVIYCHPNFKASIERYQVVPTDPLYPDQYYLNQGNNIDINAPQAWGITQGLREVRVAVIDDGVENHEDIDGRVLPGFTPTDTTGLGAPANPTWPIDIFPFTPAGHGQACAGIISASHNNLGIAGVAPCSQIIPINIFNDWFIDIQGGVQFVNYNEDIDDLADAIDWAWDDGEAEILSNSWGFVAQGANFDEITFAINRARTQGRGRLGSVVVFASGNSHSRPGCNTCFNGVTFPANVNGVITVGAITRNGDIWNYSSRGPQMDLVAPSGNLGANGDVVTTDRMGNLGYDNGNYTDTFGGTSAAAPQVSGVAALMLSVNPNLTEAQVRTILQQTATDIGPVGFDNTFGFGRLNARAALQAALPSISGPDFLCSTASFSLQNPPTGSTVSWSVSPTNLFSGATSGTGATANLSPVSSLVSGLATLTFSVISDCGVVSVDKDIWVGMAFSPSINGPYEMQINSVENFYAGIPNYPFNLYFDWQVYPTGNEWLYGQGEQGITLSFSSGGEYSVSVDLVNPCGARGSEMQVWVYNPWDMFMVYPNPTTDFTTITKKSNPIKSTIESNAESFEVSLFDQRGQEIIGRNKSNTEAILDLSKLKKGLYYIHIYYKDAVIRKQIKVE